MNTSSLPEATESVAPVAAFPSSITQTPGVQETPDTPDGHALVPSPADASGPTAVTATRVQPPELPQTMGLQPRQRIALQALASGQSPHVAAQLAGVNRATLFRWRKHHPRFIAAWNAWLAESQKTARACLAVANEQAARNVLQAIQAGDIRTSLVVLKGLGTLAPQKAGSEFAQAVKRELSDEGDKTKVAMGRMTSQMRDLFAEHKWKAQYHAEEAAKRRNWLDQYLQIPPLPRPITFEAIEQSIKASADRVKTDSRCCSLTITAATGDRRPVIDLMAKYDRASADEAHHQLNSLPKLLSSMVRWDAAESTAQKFEALGATVELRPGWPY